MKWICTLEAGIELREKIDKGNPKEILEMLKVAWSEIHNKIPDDYDDYDLERDLENIDDVLEYGDEIEEDDVDMLLTDLYDFCDNMRIWVAIN